MHELWHSRMANLAMRRSMKLLECTLISLKVPTYFFATSITMVLVLRMDLHLSAHHLLYHIHIQLTLPEHLLIHPQQLLHNLFFTTLPCLVHFYHFHPDPPYVIWNFQPMY